MQTLILAAPGALSSPIAGTPVVPDLTRGVVLEYSAEQLLLADAANVSQWFSMGGSWGSSANLMYASGTPPKFALNGFSAGHPTVNFSKAAANFLKTNSAVALSPVVNTPLTVSALVKFNPASDGFAATVFSGRTGDVGGYVYCRREVSGRISMGAGQNQEILGPIVSSGLWLVITCIFDGDNSKLYIEKVKTTGKCSSAYWDGVVLGANAISSNNLDGEIAAVKAYSRALGDEEALMLRQAWLTERGVAA